MDFLGESGVGVRSFLRLRSICSYAEKRALRLRSVPLLRGSRKLPSGLKACVPSGLVFSRDAEPSLTLVSAFSEIECFGFAERSVFVGDSIGNGKTFLGENGIGVSFFAEMHFVMFLVSPMKRLAFLIFFRGRRGSS